MLEQTKTNRKDYGACESWPPAREPGQRANEKKGAEGGAKPEPGREPAKQRAPFIERLAKVVPGLGIMLALCASVFLGTAGMLVKMTTSVHGIQVAVFR